MFKHFVSHLLKYMVPGVFTFFVDLFFLWVFMELFGWHYLIAAAMSFTIGTSLNYFFCRSFVFLRTARPIASGYIYFMGFAVTGIFLTTAGMAFFVEMVNLNAFWARVLTAALVGLWNFFTNFYINFKMNQALPRDF